MAGGDEKDFNEMKEYFDILGSSALLIGGSGSGSVTKLANQVIVNNTIAVVSEAFVLAAKAELILRRYMKRSGEDWREARFWTLRSR